MCGRFSFSLKLQDFTNTVGGEIINHTGFTSFSNYNTSPGTLVPVLTGTNDLNVYRLNNLTWGIKPDWSKTNIINSRSETLTTSKFNKKYVTKVRGIVLANGYYEWMDDTNSEGKKFKQPYYLYDETKPVLPTATILYPNSINNSFDFTICTTKATDKLGYIHARSPLILDNNNLHEWLNLNLTKLNTIQDLINSNPEPSLNAYKVSTEVDNTRNNSPDLLKELK